MDHLRILMIDILIGAQQILQAHIYVPVSTKQQGTMRLRVVLLRTYGRRPLTTEGDVGSSCQ